MASDSGSSAGDSGANERTVSIGRIPLKQMRVKRGEPEPSAPANPMNSLVPYLDLFARLDDDELSRLAGVGAEVVATLRRQVIAIDASLSRYTDLLPRLSDSELMRLTGATIKTIRFWRLCQPRATLGPRRDGPAEVGEHEGVVAAAARAKATTAPMPVASGTGPHPVANSANRLPDKRIVSPKTARASESGEHQIEPGAPAPDPAHAQRQVAHLMTFSGDPFPGFDDAGESPYLESDDDLAFEDEGEGESFP